VQSTRRLKDHNWAQIKECASIYMQIAEHSSDEGHAGEDNTQPDAAGVRANVHLSLA
jgi:hypothetical protein